MTIGLCNKNNSHTHNQMCPCPSTLACCYNNVCTYSHMVTSIIRFIMAVTQLALACFVLYHIEYCWCASHGDLYITKITSESLQGRYATSNLGITFNLKNSSLSVSDFFGNSILEVHEMVDSNHLWINIEGNKFIQVFTDKDKTYHDYFVPEHMYKGSITTFDIEVLKSLSSAYHYSNLERSVKIFIANPNTDLIASTAYALASGNINGETLPSVLPLHLVALMVEELHMYLPNERNRQNTMFNNGSIILNDECFDECPPCPDEECLSLCGYGCHCWKWVCGDCCYHLGCYGHDICCRKKFIQTRCLFPWGFKCESEYEC